MLFDQLCKLAERNNGGLGLNELALFAGSGGGILAGLLLGWRTVCAVEQDEYCRRVLFQRQRDGILGRFPIWDDARTFDGKPWRGRVDVVTAGFPCQPFSVAGQQRGEADERNLWPDTIRVICEVRPQHIFLENVPALVDDWYFARILGDLAEARLNAHWGLLSAAGVGANHRRNRLWIYANPDRNWRPWGETMGRDWWKRRKAHVGAVRNVQGGYEASSEPSIPRVANGVANQLDRVRAIGNGQVPAVAVRAWSELSNFQGER